MNISTRIFPVEDDYELAVRKLVSLGVPNRKINVLAPELHGEGARAAEAGDALFFIRGVGRVIASGNGAMGLLRAAGARKERRVDLVGGGDEELPMDDFFLLEHALRGRSRIVFVFAPEEYHRERIETAFKESGGKDLHQTRKEWWNQIRKDEDLDGHLADATDDAPHDVDNYLFRLGFELALHPSWRGMTFEEARGELSRKHPEACDAEFFRKGYDRGRAHQEALDSTTAGAAL